MAMTEAVLDSGPLIHLSEPGALDVMSDLSLFVPDAVWEEVAKYQPSASKWREIKQAHPLRARPFCIYSLKIVVAE